MFHYWLEDDKYHTLLDSSCDSEYKEMDKCEKGEKFVHIILKEMNLVNYPGVIGKDNQCSLFLARNKKANNKNKYWFEILFYKNIYWGNNR